MSPLFATVLLDPPTTLMAGGILALISTRLIGRAGLDEVWRTALLATGWGVAWSVSVAWFFFFRTDWMFAYVLDGARVPLWPAFLVFTLVCTGFCFLGALAVGLLLHLKRTALAWAATLSAALGYLGCQLMTTTQYMAVGSYAQFLAGQAPKLADDEVMVRALTASGVAIAIFSVALIGAQVRRMVRPAA
jgi:hypothetical protein